MSPAFKAVARPPKDRPRASDHPVGAWGDRAVARIPFSLKRGELFSLRLLRNESLMLHARSGLLWATFEGDPDDHLLHPGGCGTFVGPGHLVVEGLAVESGGTGVGKLRLPDGSLGFQPMSIAETP